MRGTYRRPQQEQDEESAFVSMTDMTVSFLFIVMILLAFFATQFRDEDVVPRDVFGQMRQQRDELEALLRQTSAERDAARAEVARLEPLLEEARRERDDARDRVVALEAQVRNLEELLRTFRDPLEVYFARAAAVRLRLLEQLRNGIRADFPDLAIEISAESDALRFQGEGLFRTNQASLDPQPKRIVESLASRLNEILPCYTLGARSVWNEDCNPDLAIIEAILIEGHTDSQGLELNNLILSTSRANETFITMLQHERALLEYRNFRGQPVLSVAGYGQMRPVASNETTEGRATNRRIDVRIIMHLPAGIADIDRIRERFSNPWPEAPG